MGDRKQLNFDSLDPEQQEISRKVLLAAEKYGLNPDFVLPLVYAESGFKHIPQKNGGPAFGVMQLEPDTAKSMKCDPTNLDENIDCGMKLLKSHVDNPKIGNDPYKVIAAYNTHSTTLNKFLDSYNSDPEHPEKHIHLLPEQTRQHMINIEGYHGGVLPDATFAGAQENQNEQAPEGTDETQTGTADYSNEGHGKPRPKPEERPISPIAGGVLGGALGVLAGVPIAKYKTYYDAAKSATGMIPRGDPSMRVEPAMGVEPTGESISAGEPTVSEPTSSKPAGGKGTYNYAKGFGADELEARTATGMTKAEIWADMQRAKAAKAKIAQIAPEMKLNPALGEYGLYTPESGGGGPRGGARSTPITNPVASTATETTVAKPSPRTPSSASAAKSALAQGFKNFLIPLQGAMAGFGAGFGGLDAYNRARTGDTSGSVAAGAGALASALAPFVPYAGGLSMAIPAGLAIRDVYRNSYLPVSSREEQARLAREYPDNTGNPMAQP
jgi:hypothetical protein